MEIEKTNHMNTLYDFYSSLLTNKQKNYLHLYYADDYSLGEIAEEFNVSRQAVYDNIRRTEKILMDYESKLHLAEDYLQTKKIVDELTDYIKNHYPDDERLKIGLKTLAMEKDDEARKGEVYGI